MCHTFILCVLQSKRACLEPKFSPLVIAVKALTIRNVDENLMYGKENETYSNSATINAMCCFYLWSLSKLIQQKTNGGCVGKVIY